MAKFKVGDWVQITPQADLNWSGWSKLHNDYCGKIGEIHAIYEYNDETNYDVTVEFPNGLSNGAAPGNYFISFLPDHLILTTKYDKIVREHRERGAKELQEWEKFVRKATDDNLRSVFSPPKREYKKPPQKKTPEKIDYGQFVDAWEEPTQEYPSNPDYEDDDIDLLLQQYMSDPDLNIAYDDDDKD